MTDPPDPGPHPPSRHDDLIAKALEQARAARGKGLASGFDASSVQIPGYRILTEIHRGGQGVVYKAVQDGTRRTVAIKLMLQGAFSGDRERARFEREIRVLSQIRHPGIVSIYESGETNGLVFYVMEYVSGRALHEYLRHATPQMRERLDLFARICEAVHAAHLQGVIHRDLKPDNIRIDSTGSPHILDFGLAKVAGSVPENESGEPVMMTMTGQFVGSLPWASPEQAEGIASRIDIRTDVYSLGVVLYQMLTDRFPYRVEGTTREVLTSIAESSPQRPRSLDRSISSEVETITLRALAKDRDRRYQSAGELARDIRRYLNGEPILARSDSISYVLRKSIARHKLVASSAAVILFTIAGFGVGMTVLWNLASSRGDQLETALQQRDADLDYLLDVLFGGDDLRQFARDRKVRDVVDELSASVDTRFESDPVRLATLHEMLGRSYRAFATPERAVPHLERAIALRTELYGPGHDLTLGSMNTLAEVLKDQGSYNTAIALYEQIERTLREATPTEAVQRRRLATVISNRARLLELLERMVDAKSAFDEAILLLQQDPDDPTSQRLLLFAQGHRAGIDSQMGHRKAAAEEMRRVHHEITLAFGAEHPATRTSSIKLASLLIETGEPNDALAMLQAIPVSSSSIEGKAVLAYATAMQSGPEEAVRFLDAQDHHVDLVLCKARILLHNDRSKDALEVLTLTAAGDMSPHQVFRHALLQCRAASFASPSIQHLERVVSEHFDPHSPAAWYAQGLSEYSSVQQSKRYGEAAETIGRLASLIGDTTGLKHEYVVRLEAMRAICLESDGRADEARTVRSDLLDWASRECGPYHPLTVHLAGRGTP